MFFYVSKLLAPFLTVLGVLWLALAASLILSWRRRHRAAAALVAAGLLGLTAVVFTPLPGWVLRPLQDRFPIPGGPACVDGIVMLGGGEDLGETMRRGVALIDARPMRYVILADLMRRFPNARAVFTGGSANPAQGAGDIVESDVARPVMERLGIDVSRVAFESTSRNTWENALNAAALARPKPEEIWVLLAPAYQMPRAVGVFRNVGWNVLPWPTDYGPSANGWFSLDTSARVRWVDTAIHEWIGLAAYRVTGKTSTLYPAPETRATGRC